MVSIQPYLIARDCFLGQARVLTSMSKNQKALNIVRRKNIRYKPGSV